MTIYYIQPAVIPDENAQSLQININCEEISKKKKDFILISHNNTGKKLKYKQISEKRPKKYNKRIPMSTHHIIKMISQKGIKFDNKKDVLITRVPYLAWHYKDDFKMVILELHSLDFMQDKFRQKIAAFLYNRPIIKKPLNAIIKANKENIKIGVISYGLKDDLEKLGFNKNKIFVIPDGVNLDRYKNPRKIDLKKRLKIPRNSKIALYVGSLHPWKGVRAILEAGKQLDKDIHLVIAGGTKAEAEKLKEEFPKAHFLGPTPFKDLPSYLQAADILLLPNSKISRMSTHHTSPIKLFEYMASKKPIIASKLPSIEEVVSDKEVLFAKADTPLSFRLKMNKLAKDEKKMKSLASNAYKKVKNYTWEKRVKTLLKELSN